MTVLLSWTLGFIATVLSGSFMLLCYHTVTGQNVNEDLLAVLYLLVQFHNFILLV